MGQGTGDRIRVTGRRRGVAPSFHLISTVLVSCLLSPVSMSAAQWPSLFRGVVVADSPLGVRVVSVEEASQASLADLRPEDLIVSIDGQEIHSIDEFATLSTAMKGRVTAAKVLVFRNGSPRELALSLYSYPILHTWGIEVVPDHDLRFANPQIGLDYWFRLGRGFEEAHKPAEALNAYLNALHNVPTDVATACHVSDLFTRVSHEQLDRGDLAGGVTSLHQGLVVMQKLFDYPLTKEQLQLIKDRLTDTLRVLRHTTATQKSR